MKRTLMAVAAAMALSLITAPTASANAPVRGDQVMVANVDGQCPNDAINWYGTIDIVGDGHGVYGMALYDIGVPPVFSGSSYHWHEGLAIWTGQFVDEDGDGVIDDCTPGEMVLYGTDKGVTSMASVRNPKFHSTGTVTFATGPFEGWEGRFVFQEGTGSFTSITGTLRLN